MSLNTVTAPAAVEITLDEAKSLLARAVEERGAGYTYQMLTIDEQSLCAYFDPKTKAPSCIVGQVLAYKGVTYDDLAGQEVNTYANIEALNDQGVVKVDNDTQALLEIAQSEQDAGMPWGRAVEEALATYEGRAQAYEEDGYDDPSLAYWF
ncbi:hypothetical protein EV284_3513 [Streptomyces sp. BK022]|uniref:hypothetical protein n=1 Tax=Streptomyces sp. BK022 TaxID=2512123 RepID=UPI00102A5E03|nr:hypothetical protein [Streptomyces sp. BK022]RZU36030.1 hypothetical protein EV284_3513 [Streptomyces sp. BK022]